ncbi:ABC transporter permease, partial [Rhizobium johnstonii]
MRSSVKALAYRLAPQLIALVVILLLNFITSPQFFNVVVQNDRLYGSLIDVLNRGAPVALLAIGMTLVIATKGIDLSVGAVIAICGAVAASSIVSGNSVAYTIILTLSIGLACGVWNGFLVA